MRNNTDQWKRAVWPAVLISALILGLFLFWFGFANRYIIFLYAHLGATAFDQRTRGRYWMAGLVASGLVMALYTSFSWYAGRVAARRQVAYTPPAWWRIWALCAAPLLAGIPAITMTVNWPTLPLPNALGCAMVTLLALALALQPGEWAARKPNDLAWLAVDGLALMPAMTSLRVLELPESGIGGFTPYTAWLFAAGLVFGGIAWLGVMTALRAWRRKSIPNTWELFLAGMCWGYLVGPLAHYGFRGYITAADNFFANHTGLQLAAFGVALLMATAVTTIRRKIPHLQKSTPE